MAYEHREGGGTLFNNRKTKDSQPDYRGEVLLNGKLYEIAGWIKDGKNTSWISLSVRLKQGMRKPAALTRSHEDEPDFANPPDFDDDVPF